VSADHEPALLRWLRDEAGSMETSGLAADAYELAAGMLAAANDWEAQLANLHQQLRDAQAVVDTLRSDLQHAENNAAEALRIARNQAREMAALAQAFATAQLSPAEE